MCGIVGALGYGGPGRVARMVAVVKHRGPDDEGICEDQAHGLELGHRRLAILDPSPAGHQPMALCGRYHIVYNGEIYNFSSIRAELEDRGRRFYSNTDTEVLLAAYAEWGHECLPRLRGMFAFAVWDVQQEELFLARDRFGIKPLYYAQTSGGFVFASELKALLASGVVSRAVDRAAIWEYLTYGSIPQPRTILRDARMLPAGHYMRVRRAEASVYRYWDIEQSTRGLRRELAEIPYRDAVAGVRERLEEATRLHLIADVPVGAFLSGGIDSTLVVGLMSRVTSHPIRTYSVGFEGAHSHMSELRWARIAAERFGTEHTEVVVTADDAARVFERLVAFIDQPSLDGTNTFLVSEAAKRGVTVALSGLGGDELFAGYPHFDRIGWVSRWAPKGMGPVGGVFARAGRALPGRWRTPLETLAAPPAERLAALRRILRTDEQQWAIAEGFRRSYGSVASPVERLSAALREGLDSTAQVSYAEIGGYLQDTLLRDADALSMAHSLEVRPVLLDHVLAEYAFALPSEHKLSGGMGKRVLIDAAADVLPPEIVHRPKMGFELPLMSWLRSSLRERARELFAGPAARALFSPAFLAAAAAELDGGSSRSNRLWAYAVLLAYLEEHGLDVEG